MADSSIKERAPSDEHQKLVAYLIQWISEEGYTIKCASYGNYSQCEAIDGTIPDVIGYNAQTGIWCNGEAETADSVSSHHTKEQIAKMARFVSKTGGSQSQLRIAIPAGSEDALRTVLVQLGLANASHVQARSYHV